MSAWVTFLTEVEEARKTLKCSHNGAWFRGVSKKSYTLLPKLLRNPARIKPEAEQNIYRAYLRTRMATPNGNSWNHLVDMQHYGTATRLLDWTECFAVALHFALDGQFTDTINEHDLPCLWILNPFSLACRARKSNVKSIGDFHIDPDMDYCKHFIRGKSWPYEFPFPFYSPTPNERIRAQRGFFTIHGTNEKPLEQTCAKHVVRVEISKAVIPEAVKFLKLAGIDQDFLYPDHQGWLQKVQQEYFYAPDET